MMRRLLFCSLLLISTFSIGATDTLEAFDFRACRNWEFTTDFSIHGKESEYESSSQIAQVRNAADGIGEDNVMQQWHVYAYIDMHSLDLPLEQQRRGFGVCRRIVEWKGIKLIHRSFLCVKSEGFPLSGATYSALNGNAASPVFKCIKGCSHDVPGFVHDMGYEERPASKQWKTEHQRFKRLCR